MSKITALKTSKRTKKQVNMFLDGRFVLNVDTEVAVKKGLKIGQELSDDQIKGLLEDVSLARSLNIAYRFLSYRPRSESEMKDRLHRRGFADSQIEIVINKLKEQNLLNDIAFAQFWKENREMFRPRSKRLTGMELKRKGVADEIIKEVTRGSNDMDSAYQAALKKAQRLSGESQEVFRRRLGDYLKRRGFGYTVINQTVKRLWQEITKLRDTTT